MPDNNRTQVRNPIARAAILRKGGVHDKTNKAKRQKHKQSFKKDIRAGKFGFYLFRIQLLNTRLKSRILSLESV